MRFSLQHIPYSCFVTGLFIAGICWQTQNNLSWVLAAACFATATIFIAPQANTLSKKALALLLSVILFGIGAVAYQQQQDNFDLFHSKYSGAACDLIGQITAIEESSDRYYNSRLTFHINSVKIKNKLNRWEKADAAIYIYTPQLKSKNFDINDKLLLRNITLKKTSNSSYNNFLIKENCMASVFISRLLYRRLHRPRISFSRWLSHYKLSLVSKLKEKFPPALFHFFAAVFLGNPVEKNNLSQERPYFKAWGIMHHLARSGLHLVFFILLLNLLLNIIPIPFLAKQSLQIGIVLLYSMLSWESIPFNRALLFFLFQKIAPFLKLQTHTLHLLSCVTLVTLFENPIRLFFLDFQLSFGITYALVYFSLFNEKNSQ